MWDEIVKIYYSKDYGSLFISTLFVRFDLIKKNCYFSIFIQLHKWKSRVDVYISKSNFLNLVIFPYSLMSGILRSNFIYKSCLSCLSKKKKSQNDEILKMSSFFCYFYTKLIYCINNTVITYFIRIIFDINFFFRQWNLKE